MRESLRRLAFDDEAMPTRGACRRVRVELLDGEFINVQLDRKAKGSDLLDKICDDLDLVEKDYFGLLHAQRGDSRCWVDLNRRLSKTFRNEPWEVCFTVRFYPPEPSELVDDNTRYQLTMAVRRDLVEGRLPCSSITHALLASYLLQAELGDYHNGVSLVDRKLVPLQVVDEEFEEKATQLYVKHKGQTPAEAELNYLENAKKLPLYGVEMHRVQDSIGIDITLAVGAAGVAVFRDGLLSTPLNRFPWTKITKISYNKRMYTLRLRASEFDEYESHVSFKLPSTRACKKLWRCSVEHHIFFRRESPVKVERVLGFPSLGSRRISCRRTLRQMRAEPLAREIMA